MSNISSIDLARPHRTATIACKACGEKWQATYPDNAVGLECPVCHTWVNEYGTVVSRRTCKTCDRIFTVCPPADWDYCYGDDCQSYDPSLDVDKFWGSVRRDDD